MIANLVTTLLLALGVATGNVSSNTYKGGNAFNHVEKEHEKPTKKAVETVNIQYSYDQVATYEDNDNICGKYFLRNNDQIPTTYNNYMYIYNSEYSFIQKNVNQKHAELYEVLEINNYYDTNVKVKFSNSFGLSFGSNQGYLKVSRVWKTEDPTINSLINLTLNSSTYSQIQTIVTKLTNNQITNQKLVDTSETITGANGLDMQILYAETPIIEIAARSTIYLFTRQAINMNTNNYITNIQPLGLTIEGSILVSDVNNEIIDVPNLMFTILTLPFAWYSTAFNLTIFPNTPYALNFGNLILTILAAMILLYLIKKVIK